MTDVEAELREQFEAALEGAEYPVTGPGDLLPVLPDGPGTTFEAGDVRFSAMELGASLGGQADFPYEDAESMIDDLMAALRTSGMLDQGN